MGTTSMNDGRPGETKLSSFGWTAAVTIKLLVDSGSMRKKIFTS
jgi:hypothetical protein